MHVVNAAGPLKNLAIFLVVFAVVCAAGSYLEPFSRSYEIKTAARIACNELSTEKRFKQDTKWQEHFVLAARRAGVDLKPGQYDFKMTLTGQSNDCSVKIAWKESMPIFLLGDFLDIKPYVFVQRLDQEFSVKARY